MNYLYPLFYCIFTAASVVFAHSVTQTVSPMTATFITFLICLLWFNIVNVKKMKQTYTGCFSNLKLIFLINITTAVNWITTFLAIRYMNPVIFVAIFMALMPVMSCLIKRTIMKKPLKRIDLIVSICVIFLVSLLVFFQNVKHLTLDNEYYWLSLLLTVVSSFSAASYLLLSKHVENKLSLTSAQILSVRFYLLIVVTGISVMAQAHFAMIGNNDFFWIRLLLLALLTSILPLYFLQKSINKIGAIKTSFFIPITPVFAFAIIMAAHQTINFEILPILLLLTLLLIGYAVYSKKYQQKKNSISLWKRCALGRVD